MNAMWQFKIAGLGAFPPPAPTAVDGLEWAVTGNAVAGPGGEEIDASEVLLNFAVEKWWCGREYIPVNYTPVEAALVAVRARADAWTNIGTAGSKLDGVELLKHRHEVYVDALVRINRDLEARLAGLF